MVNNEFANEVRGDATLKAEEIICELMKGDFQSGKVSDAHSTNVVKSKHILCIPTGIFARHACVNYVDHSIISHQFHA